MGRCLGCALAKTIKLKSMEEFLMSKTTNTDASVEFAKNVVKTRFEDLSP